MDEKTLKDMRNMVEIQGSNGTWNYDPYMQGMYNGMELMLAMVEGREPVYKEAPDEWVGDIDTSSVIGDPVPSESIRTEKL
jgi:hypothetical protein